MRSIIRRAAALAVVVSSVTFGQAAFIKADKAPDAVNEALEEFIQALPVQVNCDQADAWTVRGGPREAAGMLKDELENRKWGILETGQLELSYAVLVDPDPSDEYAIALGGILPAESEGDTFAYLALCRIAPPQGDIPNRTAGMN